jgi:drug/metabolite transporter (DMT)-like permease
MVLASGTGPLMQSVVRLASSDLHPFEIVFLRNLLAFAFLVPFFLYTGKFKLRTAHPGQHVIRGAIQVTAMCVTWYAISVIPLAQVTAILFSSTMFASLGAIVFLGEPSHFRRWAAIAGGIVGMLVIVRPGVVEVETGAFLAVAGAILFAITRLIVKRLTKWDTAPTIVMWMAITTTPLSLIPAVFVWTWPSWELIGMMAIIAGLGTVTHLLTTQAMREGNLTALEPVSFTRLIWAALIGYVIFSEIPSLWTLLGSGIIVVSIMALVRSEVRERRNAKAQPA